MIDNLGLQLPRCDSNPTCRSANTDADVANPLDQTLPVRVDLDTP
jgi:hypothetical protein